MIAAPHRVLRSPRHRRLASCRHSTASLIMVGAVIGSQRPRRIAARSGGHSDLAWATCEEGRASARRPLVRRWPQSASAAPARALSFRARALRCLRHPDDVRARLRKLRAPTLRQRRRGVAPLVRIGARSAEPPAEAVRAAHRRPTRGADSARAREQCWTRACGASSRRAPASAATSTRASCRSRHRACRCSGTVTVAETSASSKGRGVRRLWLRGLGDATAEQPPGARRASKSILTAAWSRGRASSTVGREHDFGIVRDAATLG